MGTRRFVSFVWVVLFVLFVFNSRSSAHGRHGDFPDTPTLSNLILTPLTNQGLTVGPDGHFYAAGRNTPANAIDCPIWRIDPDNPSLVLVGFVPPASGGTTCITIGMAFNTAGELFVANTPSGAIYRLTPDENNPAMGILFATTAPNTANLAFDRDGNLWATDGPSNQGRVYKIPPAGGAATVVFRIPTLRNTLGVGRDVLRFPVGTAAGLGISTGIAFDEEGDLYITDVTRGAIWRAQFYRDGSLRSETGCDTTYPADTLCLENLYVQHPILSGAGQLALDRKGNIWVPSLDRNALIFVSRDREVSEVFRNPVSATTGLRNEGPLEFPAGIALRGRMLCLSNLDSDIQDNSPNSAGEVKPAGPDRGKIVCMDQNTFIPGLPLPVGEDRRGRNRPWFWF